MLVALFARLGSAPAPRRVCVTPTSFLATACISSDVPSLSHTFGDAPDANRAPMISTSPLFIAWASGDTPANVGTSVFARAPISNFTRSTFLDSTAR